MSLESQVTEVLTAANGLVTTFNGKKASIDAATQAQQAAFQAWQNQFAQRAQQNLLRDSGRFFNPDLPENVGAARKAGLLAAFGAGDNLVLCNGSTVVSAGGFYSDNQTNGGTNGVLSDAVKTLTDRTRGVGNARFGVEFWVAEFRMGANPTLFPSVGIDGATRYISTWYSVPVIKGTYLAWVSAVSGSVAMNFGSYRNGVASNNNIVRPGDGWVHLASVYEDPAGYIMHELLATPGTVFRVALPAVIAGDLRGLVHTSPILTQWY